MANARVGVQYGYRSFSLQSGSPLFPSRAHTSIGALTAQLRLDRLDNLNFTHNGYRLDARVYSSLNSLGAEDQYSYWSVAAAVRAAGNAVRRMWLAPLRTGARMAG